MTIITCPKGKGALVRKIHKRTKYDYNKTKLILARNYGITIELSTGADKYLKHKTKKLVILVSAQGNVLINTGQNTYRDARASFNTVMRHYDSTLADYTIVGSDVKLD